MTTRYPHLLSEGRIGTLSLRNRILVTAMGVSLSEDDGTIGERLIAYHEEQARGGAGSHAAGGGQFIERACIGGLRLQRGVGCGGHGLQVRGRSGAVRHVEGLGVHGRNPRCRATDRRSIAS